MDKNSIISLYGNVAIIKGYCPVCKGYAFIRNGKLLCCDYALDAKPDKYKRESIPEQRRHLPPLKFRLEQLEKQENRCFYCNRHFGNVVYKKNKTIKLRTHWDHKIPYALSQNNEIYNFVAACHICNAMKYSKVFQTKDEAQVYLTLKWERKKYSDNPPL